MKFLLVALLCAFAALSSAQKVSYDGYKVLAVTPITAKHLEVLKSLESLGEIDFWRTPKTPNAAAHILIGPSVQTFFLTLVQAYGMKVETYIEDVGKAIAIENAKNDGAEPFFGWTQYYGLDEINKWLDSLANQYEIATIVEAGDTFEGRKIRGIKVSTGPGKSAAVLEGGIHAREWISTSTVTYILNEFLTSSDPTVTSLLDTYDIYFFPVTNPDGYVYTHTKDRMWRKTRSHKGIQICRGADPNRNWDDHWGEAGTSPEHCSDLYPGSEPFSEIETKTYSEFLKTIDDLSVYISLHAYQQLLMLPWGYTSQHIPDYKEMMAIGMKAAAALQAVHNTKYQVGSIAEIIYEASGSSVDWVRDMLGTKSAFAFELRDTGRHGFILPPDQIIPTGEETIEAVKVLLEESRNRA